MKARIGLSVLVALLLFGTASAVQEDEAGQLNRCVRQAKQLALIVLPLDAEFWEQHFRAENFLITSRQSSVTIQSDRVSCTLDATTFRPVLFSRIRGSAWPHFYTELLPKEGLMMRLQRLEPTFRLENSFALFDRISEDALTGSISYRFRRFSNLYRRFPVSSHNEFVEIDPYSGALVRYVSIQDEDALPAKIGAVAKNLLPIGTLRVTAIDVLANLKLDVPLRLIALGIHYAVPNEIPISRPYDGIYSASEDHRTFASSRTAIPVFRMMFQSYNWTHAVVDVDARDGRPISSAVRSLNQFQSSDQYFRRQAVERFLIQSTLDRSYKVLLSNGEMAQILPVTESQTAYRVNGRACAMIGDWFVFGNYSADSGMISFHFAHRQVSLKVPDSLAKRVFSVSQGPIVVPDSQVLDLDPLNPP